MKQYKNEIGKLHWTEEGKENLINRVKANSLQEKMVRHRLPFVKYAAIAAMICLFSVTTYATGTLQSVVDVFSPILGGTPVQTEIIEKIGHPIGASDTKDGITISADAIIGDNNNICVVYSIANADGTPFLLPEGIPAEKVFFAGDNGTELPAVMDGGFHGSIGVTYSNKQDGTLQIVEILTSKKTMPIGKNVTAKFSKLSYSDAENNLVTLLDSSWSLRYELSYENVTTTIPVDKQFKRDDLTFTVDNIKISPIAVNVEYSVNAVPDLDNKENGRVSNKNNTEINKFLNNLDLIITKTDGTIIDLTEQSSGGLTPNKGTTLGRKGMVFEEILSLDEIKSITFGDVVIPLI